MFSKPVDINEVPDYLKIIQEPMDLETMMTKIDQHKYNCAQDFLNDVELICANALEYNPDSHARIYASGSVLPAGHARIYASECKGFEFRLTPS
ncbi:ATPase AAA domain-containing protein 2 [Homalodisca vitripennis]|nr:ATPase AAA domain-containing protein 2 [Homalodisca vitripennis]